MADIKKGTDKIGVFLGRLQPPHKGHLAVIEKALSECDKVVIIIGSSNKKDTLRNPFSFELRKTLLINSLKKSEDKKRIKIYGLPDWSQEDKTEDNSIWGHYLYYNMVSRAGQKNFTFYYCDEADVIKSWFDDEVKKYIDFCVSDRTFFEGISSTKIRNALINFSKDDKLYLKKYLPKAVYSQVNKLRDHLLKVSKKPNADFTME